MEFWCTANGWWYQERWKKNVKRLPYWSTWYSEDESFNEKLYFIAEYGQRNRSKCKLLQRLCDCSKGARSENYPVTKDEKTLVDSLWKCLEVMKCKIPSYVTLCRWSAKQTIPLSVLARNQTKGLDSRSRRDRK